MYSKVDFIPGILLFKIPQKLYEKFFKILYIAYSIVDEYTSYMRSDIFDACVAAIQGINGGVSTYDPTYTYQTTIAQTYRGAKFFGEINDSPVACIWMDSESRFHIGADQRYPIMYMTVRTLFEGTPDGTPAVDAAENFLEDLDHVCKHFRRWALSHNGVETGIIEIRPLNLATDSGVLEPRSVAEFVFEIVYLNNP